MKKSFILLSAIILSSVVFEGCFKKGPDDPFISLHSRKARLVGDWTISAGSGKTANGTTITTWSYANPTLTSTSGSTTTTQTVTYKTSYKKDGTWTSESTTTGTIFGQTYKDVKTESGTWEFAGGVGSVKKKTQLVAATLSSVEVQTVGTTTTTTTNTYSGQESVSVFTIDELKNKTIIVKWDNSSTSGSTTSSDSGQYTLTQ